MALVMWLRPAETPSFWITSQQIPTDEWVARQGTRHVLGMRLRTTSSAIRDRIYGSRPHGADWRPWAISDKASRPSLALARKTAFAERLIGSIPA